MVEKLSSFSKYFFELFAGQKVKSTLEVLCLRPDALWIIIDRVFIFTKKSWRKEPFASKHKFSTDFAFATNAFNVKYVGIFTDAVGKWDLNLLADVHKPFFVNNYFGLGNDSFFDV